LRWRCDVGDGDELGDACEPFVPTRVGGLVAEKFMGSQEHCRWAGLPGGECTRGGRGGVGD
jgi:hypothetical protein